MRKKRKRGRYNQLLEISDMFHWRIRKKNIIRDTRVPCLCSYVIMFKFSCHIHVLSWLTSTIMFICCHGYTCCHVYMSSCLYVVILDFHCRVFVCVVMYDFRCHVYVLSCLAFLEWDLEMDILGIYLPVHCCTMCDLHLLVDALLLLPKES